ncbi:MAG: hypothetical protein ABH971_02620, partial [bacterium]
ERERERERELKKLSEKSVEIFEENFSKYPKVDEKEAKKIAEKWNFDKLGINLIQRETDVILYQIKDEKESNIELGILDLNYQEEKNAGTHARIKFCTSKKLGVYIDWRSTHIEEGLGCGEKNAQKRNWCNIQHTIKGYICEGDQEKRYLIVVNDTGKFEMVKDIIKEDKIFSKKLSDMLVRYQISKLFLGRVEHKLEIEKRTWDAQTVGRKKEIYKYKRSQETSE